MVTPCSRKGLGGLWKKGSASHVHPRGAWLGGQNSGAPRVLEVLSDPAAPSPAGSHVYQQLGEELRQPRAGAGTHLDQDLPDAPRSAGRTGRHFL